VQSPTSIDTPSSSAITLVLGGHHPLTMYGLSQIFEKERDCRVLAVCSDAESIVRAVRRHQPHLAIVDFDCSAIAAVVRRITGEGLVTRVIVLEAASERSERIQAARLGAQVVVLKPLPPAAFVARVRAVHETEPLPHTEGRGVVIRIARAGASSRPAQRRLTPRETEIARLAVQGVSTKEIAVRLAVKQGTIKIHLHSIYAKLDVDGRLGLMLYVRRHRLPHVSS
jgi:two-component system nitrate/nitrite response regulator NarL